MGYALAVRWRAEDLRKLAFGSISGSYAALGGALQNPIVQFKIANDTDANIILSYDGINDHEFVADISFVLFDIGSNKSIGNGLFLAKGDILYVKQESGAPSSGNVYMSAYYPSEW